MGGVNRTIIVSTVLIMATGAYRVFLVKPTGADGTSRTATLTRVIVGGYVLAIIASVIDLVGGPASQVAGLLLALAIMTAAYAVLPDLFSRISTRKGA